MDLAVSSANRHPYPVSSGVLRLGRNSRKEKEMKARKNETVNLVKEKHDASMAQKVTKANAEDILIEVGPAYLRARDRKQKAESEMATARELGFLALDVLVGKDIPQRAELPYKKDGMYFGRFLVGKTEDTEVIDSEKLQKLLTDEQWDMVTNRVLDQEKLAEAVEKGLITEGQLKKATKIQPGSPGYLKVLAKPIGQKLTKPEMIAPVIELPKR